MKTEKSKIDMQKTFDLQEVDPLPSQVTEKINTEMQKSIEEYAQYCERLLAFRKKSIKTPFNADLFGHCGEKNNLPSKTVPSQSMGIRELLSRYSQGLPIGTKAPIYDGEDHDLPDPRTLDLVDLQELKESIRDEIRTLRTPKAKHAQTDEKAENSASVSS